MSDTVINRATAFDQEPIRLLLDQAAPYSIRPPEETLFSISGRGHLENPTTDLLCYFMQPTRQHGLTTSFLRAFFKCMSINPDTLSFDRVTVVPQVQTKDGKWIDVLVTGPDWVLVIENKLHAGLDNPLGSYEEYAKRFAVHQRHFAILSPSPQTATGWTSVTYDRFCTELRDILPEASTSKWHVFVKEFILHLETELYSRTMKLGDDQIAFVEQYLPEIEQVKKLAAAYTQVLLEQFKECISAAIPSHTFVEWDANYALKCRDLEEHMWEFDLHTPGHEGGNGRFSITIWRKHLKDEQQQIAADILAGMRHVTEGYSWDGWIAEGIETRAAAFETLGRKAGELAKIWPG